MKLEIVKLTHGVFRLREKEREPNLKLNIFLEPLDWAQHKLQCMIYSCTKTLPFRKPQIKHNRNLKVNKKFHHNVLKKNWPVKFDLRVSDERCTCSIQGEKEHKTPSGFKIFLQEGIASQGWGRSRNTESAMPKNSSGNPSPCISLTPTVTKLLTPVFSKSSLSK